MYSTRGILQSLPRNVNVFKGWSYVCMLIMSLEFLRRLGSHLHELLIILDSSQFA